MSRPQGLDVFIYLRKSRSDIEEERRAIEEGKEYDTLARHRRNLMELLKRDGHNLIDIFEELVTGESIIERTEVQKMLKRMDTGEAEAVIVMDIDRLGRGDMYDSGILDRAFRYNSIKLITPTEVYDPDSESWELVFSVKSMLARQELKSITKRLQGGRRDKAGLGRSISKKPPYGYLRDKDLKLYPDPDNAWVVKKIFEMMRDGHGRQAVAAELDRLEIATPSSKSTNWAPSTITAIIRNEVYLGHIIWGKITYSKRGGKYKKKKMAPEEWIRKDHAHEPLVSQELFEAANLAYSGRHRPSTTANKKLSNPFAGILKCEVCGHTLVYRPRPNRPNDYINCANPACKGVQRSVALSLVEERVISSLEEYIEDFEVESQKNRTVDDSVINLREKAISKKQKELLGLSEQKNNLHDLLEQGVYDVQTFMERQKYLVEKMSKLVDEIQVLKEEIQKEQLKNKNILEFVPKVKLVLEAYKQTDDIEKKNRLLKSILEKATYLRKKDWNKKGHFEIQIYTKI